MRAPAFWWRPPGIAAAMLAPAAAVYGRIAATRMRRAGARASVPVICVGNLTLGGAGKTPTALAVARLLQAAGERPFLLSRGYGGSERGPLLVDPGRHDTGRVGDEAVLLARAFPTVVGADRAAGARLAAEAGASAVVLDDGFQNPALEKDLSIVVVDGEYGTGNGRVFPAGPLRAPLSAQLDKAQALVIVGEGNAGGLASTVRDLPVLRAKLVPQSAAAKELAGRRVLAFAGIGHPEKFFATLRSVGAVLVETRAFADHHRYTAREAQALVAAARERSLLPVTTEKDMVRIKETPSLAELARIARPLPVHIEWEDEKAVRALLARAINP